MIRVVFSRRVDRAYMAGLSAKGEGNLLRRPCLPKAVKDWSLRSVQIKLITIGGRSLTFGASCQKAGVSTGGGGGASAGEPGASREGWSVSTGSIQYQGSEHHRGHWTRRWYPRARCAPGGVGEEYRRNESRPRCSVRGQPATPTGPSRLDRVLDSVLEWQCQSRRQPLWVLWTPGV